MAATSKGKEIKTSTILPLFVETRNQLVKKEIADAEPLELHLAPLQGDEKDEARGVVEHGGGNGGGAGASQRQNSLDCQPNHISLKQYKLHGVRSGILKVGFHVYLEQLLQVVSAPCELFL